MWVGEKLRKLWRSREDERDKERVGENHEGGEGECRRSGREEERGKEGRKRRGKK